MNTTDKVDQMMPQVLPNEDVATAAKPAHTPGPWRSPCERLEACNAYEADQARIADLLAALWKCEERFTARRDEEGRAIARAAIAKAEA